MRLAIAFGARGKGAALAHYEPARVVINLTKMRGAGSLAHEWGHAFDDNLGTLLGFGGLNTFISTVPYPKLANSESKTAKAMGELMVLMRHKELSPEEAIEYAENRIENIITNSLQTLVESMCNRFNIENEYRNLFYDLDQYMRHDNGETSLDSILLRYIKEEDIKKDAANMYRLRSIKHKINNEKNKIIFYIHSEEKEKVRTDYYESALKLDKGRKLGYYSLPYEMFARSFESWIEDELTFRGMKNQYLVHSTQNSLYGGLDPYPQGKEREVINNGLRKLMNTFIEEFGNGYGQSHTMDIFYKDRNSYKSYVKNIRVIKKETNSKTNIDNAEINELQDLKNKLISMGKNSIASKLSYSEYMNKLAYTGKTQLGYAGIGFYDFKKGKITGSGNSKSYVDINTNRGKVIYIDSNQKPEKQLEGLIEAIIRSSMCNKYGNNANTVMIAEGMIYMACKNYGLDVRTYCNNDRFNGLIKNKEQTKIYLNLCKQNYDGINQIIFS